jgi:hypothetical protein
VNDGTSTRVAPHRADYTWRFFGGSDAASIRLHFKDFSLSKPDNALEIRTANNQLVQTLQGWLPKGGWTAPIPGTAAMWRLVTSSASQKEGFAIDEVEITRAKPGGPVTVPPIPGMNTEVYGAFAGPNVDHYYHFEVTEPGLYDVFVEAGLGVTVGLAMRRGLVLPAVGDAEFAVETQGQSKLISANLSPGHYTVLVRGLSGSGGYTFMVNRVAYVFDVEVELDGFSVAERPRAVCALRALFREATERLYSATDGYMRFGKIYYFTETHFDHPVDVQINNESGRAQSPFLTIHTLFDSLDLYLEELDGYRNSFECGGPSPPPKASDHDDGAGALVHEWGHYRFGLRDEYIELPANTPTQCPYSLMGSRHVVEYCTAITHDPFGRWPIATFSTPGPDSYWAELHDSFEDMPERQTTPNPHLFVNTAIRRTLIFREDVICDYGYGADCE